MLTFPWDSPVYTNITTDYEKNTKSITFEFPMHGGDMYAVLFHDILIEAIERLSEGKLDKFVKDHYALRVEPKRIIRNGPALIVFWKDGTKTVVKCHDEEFDYEKGLAMALARRLWNRSQTIKHVKSIEEQEEKKVGR